MVDKPLWFAMLFNTNVAQGIVGDVKMSARLHRTRRAAVKEASEWSQMVGGQRVTVNHNVTGHTPGYLTFVHGILPPERKPK